MLLKGVTIRGLEVFEALAQTGTVAGAANLTGLSQPAVSQQIKNLEAALDTDLLDHTRRPMQLTPAGRGFLNRTKAVLGELRSAHNELSVVDLAHLSALRMGVIDDFDNDLTPRLVTILAESMTRCQFKLTTAPSHEILNELSERRMDMAITAVRDTTAEGVVEYPLVQDPFFIVCKKGASKSAGGLEGLMQDLPFLRYDAEQLNGQHVEAHLARQKLEFPQRFEIGSHLSLMTLAARGVGWAITTPLGYMRAERFHEELDVHPLPFEPFARRISLLAAADWAETVPEDIARTARNLIGEMVVTPALALLPWLKDDFRLLTD